jgi:molybdate transport system substrate-binding protein
MTRRLPGKIAAFSFVATTATGGVAVHAAELHVLTSGVFPAAYKALGPDFAAKTGNTH